MEGSSEKICKPKISDKKIEDIKKKLNQIQNISQKNNQKINVETSDIVQDAYDKERLRLDDAH
jgi:hypothetical protein